MLDKESKKKKKKAEKKAGKKHKTNAPFVFLVRASRLAPAFWNTYSNKYST